MEMIKKILPHYLTVISAIMFVLASPVWGQEYLVFLGLVPLFLLWDKKPSWKTLIKEGYWLQIIFCVGVFFWVPQSFANLWANNWAFNLLLFITISSLVEFQFIIFMPLGRLLQQKLKNPLLVSVSLGLLYAIVDSYYPKFFKDTLAHALWEQTNVLSHFNFYYGSYLLTFLIVIINYFLYLLWKNSKAKSVAVYVLVLLATYFLPLKPASSNKEAVELFVVNTNFAFDEKKNNLNYVFETFDTIEKSLLSIPEGSTVVFPETVYPFDYLNSSEIKAEKFNLRLKEVITQRKLNVFLGNVTLINNQKINILLLIREDGSVDYMVKKRLFPFGEYIPFDWVPGFINLFPPTMVDVPLENKQYVDLKGIRYGSAICYESIFSEHLRDLKKDGVQIGLNVSNETWFGDFGEAQLSFALSVFSSIENDLPLVRATNEGSGGLINPPLIEDYFLNQHKVTIKTYKVFYQK